MSQWYYLQKGRPFGPVSTRELMLEIQSRRLNAHDLVFKEHDTEWREVSLFPELHEHQISLQHPDKNSDEWVLLIRKNDAYRQLGPFTRAEIVSKLQAGEIAFTDYVWRKGLKEWYKIIALSEFCLPLSVSHKMSSHEVTNTELIEITKKLPLPQEVYTPPALPVLAATEKINSVEREVKFTNKSKKNKAAPAAVAKRISLVNYYSQLSLIRKIAFVGFSTLFMASLLFFVTYLSSYRDRHNSRLYVPTVSFVAPTISSPAPPTLSTVEIVPVELDKTAIPAVRRIPTYLQAKKEFEGSDNPRIKIITDGSHHYPISVTLSSEAGQVLYLRSFVRRIRLYKEEDRLLELSKLNLLPGYYDVTLEVEKLKHTLKVNFATQSTSDFIKKIKRHRKQIFMYYNEERFGFVKVAGRLEKATYLLTQNAENLTNFNSWSHAYRSWRKNFARIENNTLKSINAKNRTNYVHASKWLRLKALHSSINNMAKELNRTKMRGQQASSRDLKEAALELLKLKEEMILDSLSK